MAAANIFIMEKPRVLIKRAIAAAAIAAGLIIMTPFAETDALFEYVKLPDEVYSWELVETEKLYGAEIYTISMTSQSWRGKEWTHDLTVIRPEEIRFPEKNLFMIWSDRYGEIELAVLAEIAAYAGAGAAIINRVPNQPFFEGRREDALIAYTFEKYLRTGDRTWPLLFPMVKSAVRGMDAASEFSLSEFGEEVKEFAVGGSSKRGWTAYLAAAADDRIEGAAPMVFDMLNIPAQLEWAEAVWGRQSEMIGDYTDIGLHEMIGEPELTELLSWVDPHSYIDHYDMPVLILLGTNDPYWVVDSTRHYWHSIPPPRHMYYAPNAGHDLGVGDAGRGIDALAALGEWYRLLAEGTEMPSIEWEFKKHGGGAEASVSSDRPILEARLLQADSPERDMREARWESREIPLSAGEKRMAASVESPETGFRAFLVELVLNLEGGRSITLSTEARVIPAVH